MKCNSKSPDWMVRLEQVGATYPNGTCTLNPVNIDRRAGEFTVLLGLSGAGKSTL